MQILFSICQKMWSDSQQQENEQGYFWSWEAEWQNLADLYSSDSVEDTAEVLIKVFKKSWWSKILKHLEDQREQDESFHLF